MSENPKPVEDTSAPAPTTEAPAPDPAPAADTPADAAEDAVTETPVPAEPAKEEEKKEPKTEGTLSYKNDVGLKKFFPARHYHFWFTDEPVEVKALHKALEKGNVDDATAAWASQSGKGLLFWAKRPEDKTTPYGVFNLSEFTDLGEHGANDVVFSVNGHKHTFVASSSDDRASWLAALTIKVEEAKSQKDTITDSEGYKAELEKLTKPSAPAAAAPKKSSESKAKEAVKDKPEDEAAPVEGSRSRSRRRASKFVSSFLPKKEETEGDKEEKKEEKEEKKEEIKEEKGETKDVVEEPPVAESSGAAEVAAPAEATTDAPAAEPEKKAETPKGKRLSFFGSLIRKPGGQGEKAEKDAGPAKDTETTPPVSSEPPQLDPVDASTSKPIEPETVTSPETTEPPKDVKDAKDAKDAPEEPAPAEPPAKAGRRSSFFSNLSGAKKEKKPESTDAEPAETVKKIFRSMSKVMRPKEKAPAAPAEPEPVTEGTDKPEPAKDAPAEGGPSVNGTDDPEGKKESAPDAPAVGASSQPVPTPA